MSEKKSSLLDKRIAEFFESSTELLTDIHARNKAAGTKGAATKKRKKQKPLSRPKRDTD
jgi:hypothetical protein